VVAVLSHRDPTLLQRLISTILRGERTVVLLHHDPRGVPHGLRESDRLRLVPDPLPCDWGRMNFADAMVRCMSEAGRCFPDFSWVLLISGQDYPAQSLRLTEERLAAEPHDALVRHFPVPERPVPGEDPWQTLCRARYLHRIRVPRTRRSMPWPRRHPFRSGRELYVGDTWLNLRASAAVHVVEQFHRQPEVRRYLSWCSSPDEALIPTLLLNDADHLRFANDRRRFIKWTSGAAHPALLTEEHFDAITTSGDFFARKVDSYASGVLLDRLDDFVDQQ